MRSDVEKTGFKLAVADESSTRERTLGNILEFTKNKSDCSQKNLAVTLMKLSKIGGLEDGLSMPPTTFPPRTSLYESCVFPAGLSSIIAVSKYQNRALRSFISLQ